MPILLEEDYNMKLPNMHKVRQSFKKDKIDDIEKTINEEFEKESILSTIKPGQKVAVAVGSRGIRNLKKIVKLTIDKIKSLGAEPFIISAMGSHGGGSEEGQREVLYGYGITEEYIILSVYRFYYTNIIIY
ncbi:MAG: hypothetical protein ACTHW2_06425 [Tissierella sp.]|uniref:hypothetical protein n=1 Tax=Tissierella sp. TaxID=41274 RepID=UPI003F99A7E2